MTPSSASCPLYSSRKGDPSIPGTRDNPENVMIVIMAETSADSETNRLIEAASRGNQSAWFEILDRHRERLRRMVVLRMDRRLQGRVDASDIIQDACVDAIQRLPDYLDRPTMPLFLWLRFLVGQRLVDEHRRHL